MARVIRNAPADVISVKVGVNVVDLDAMRLRSFVPAVHGFLDTIRDGHPVLIGALAVPALLRSSGVAPTRRATRALRSR
ncbi:hypothetical protein [Yonghaparkia sp. Root332]|uniref:hypothetical protein n=1 Tax=Yonghaparkia sp. Root332 TaxID=1736516 RepID=UPI0006FD7ADF|nr:hypothetical protein ASC54_12280 [Yonghaparkia sp. Root332]